MTSCFQISKLTPKQLNERIVLYVWIANINEKGNSLWFITGQDSSGCIQIVIKENKELISRLKEIKKGDLLEIRGIVRKKRVQENKKEGSEEELEIELTEFQLINANSSNKDFLFPNIKEDNKYRYRYLDLRNNPNSKKLLLIKNRFCYELRKFFHEREFVDIETPILANNSPEGAKCFVVPSNLKNRYYTLPQSAQIFKQLLMVSGFDKYYQIAKSFRNEDSRSNRQTEFSQLELEMSFTTSQQIRQLIEEMLKTVLKNVFGYQIKVPFPTLTYQEVVKKYGTDKPDLRSNPKNGKELSFVWIVDWPLFEYNEETKKYESARHPFTTPQKEYIKPLLSNEVKPEKIICDAFDLVCNGEEVLSGSIRIHQAELQAKVLEILGYNEEERKKNFGYFLQALEFAAPPHGGMGLGIDRLLATILQVKSLKELIAFPKNIDGTCSLTGAPNFMEKTFD